MKTTEYLYGTTSDEFSDMSYKCALEHKKKLADELISVLYEEPLKDRDTDRIFDVIKARRHNDELLIELESSKS